MMKIEDIRRDDQLLNAIDWDMTPEEAVRLYLEWGNNWASRSNYVIRSKDDESYYFVVNTWGPAPKIYFIRRNSEAAEELAEIPLPEDLRKRFLAEIGGNKGVYALNSELRRWLQAQLYRYHA